jgi:hypothetical protein
MKYLCQYKTDVKYDMVRFDTLIRYERFPALKNKTI